MERDSSVWQGLTLEKTEKGMFLGLARQALHQGIQRQWATMDPVDRARRLGIQDRHVGELTAILCSVGAGWPGPIYGERTLTPPQGGVETVASTQQGPDTQDGGSSVEAFVGEVVTPALFTKFLREESLGIAWFMAPWEWVFCFLYWAAGSPAWEEDWRVQLDTWSRHASYPDWLATWEQRVVEDPYNQGYRHIVVREACLAALVGLDADKRRARAQEAG